MRRRRPRRRRGLRKGIFLVPTLFTVGNVFCGFLSMVETLRGELEKAAVAILVAVVADVLDGRIARLTGTTSSFGEAYDSLADVVSFGAAPALLAVQWGLWQRPKLGIAVAFLFLVAGSIRLARFNVQEHSTRYFTGLPIPAGASAIALVVLISPDRVRDPRMLWVTAAFVLALALLMVSNLRYRAFKDIDLKRRWPATTVFVIAFVFSMIVFARSKVLAILLAVYILSAPARVIASWVRGQRQGGTDGEAAAGAPAGKEEEGVADAAADRPA